MWYLKCVLKHCTFVLYACALSELLISRFSAILKSFCMNAGTRYSETLFLKLDTDASNMTSTKQNSISEEIEFLPKGILNKQFWTKCKGGPFAKFWKSAILLLNFERLENGKY